MTNINISAQPFTTLLAFITYIYSLMRTITIDILNDKVLGILKDLEVLKLIRLRKEKTAAASGQDWAKYKGALSKQSLKEIERQLNELRGEWE